MTAFNFGGIKETSAVGVSKSLKPWGIYEVKFDGLELNDIKGKKDPEAVYKTIKMSFSNDEGVFVNNLFIPATEQDAERPVYKNKDNHEYEAPSRFEDFKWTLLQLAQVVNPEGYKKLQEQSSKIKGMDDFIKLIMMCANAKKGVTTHLKLTGRTTEDGKTYARIPRIVGVNKEGELFVSDKFVGDNLEFTLYEADKAKAYHSAKPTDMETADTEGGHGSEEDLNEIDFNGL